MDKKRAILNVSTSILFRLLILFASLFSRRYLVLYLGAEANGIYSLFVSILGFLAIADLGLGRAISFSMYKPIVDNDSNTLSGLYCMFKKIYVFIGLVIFTIGLFIIPFLNALAKENSGDLDLYYTYLIFLLSVSITYIYAHKVSLINAYKDNYITTTIRSLGLIFEALMQILIIVVFKSFIGFFFIILVSNFIQWIVINFIFNKSYKHSVAANATLTSSVKSEVLKNTKAMFMHKAGSILSNTSTSLIISTLISVVTLGKYSNYVLIMSGMSGLLMLVFTSITSIIGHSIAKNTSFQIMSQFKKIYVMNVFMGFVFYLGFLSTASDIILIMFGYNQMIDSSIVLYLTISNFILFMRQTTLLFRTASGNFYHDRYKPLIQGFVSIVLSLILVHYIGLIGVLISHIFTDLFIGHTVEPYVVFKYGFKMSPKKYYFINYFVMLTFIVSVAFFEMINKTNISNRWGQFFVNGFLSIIMSVTILMIPYFTYKPYRTIVNSLIKSGLSIFPNNSRT